MCINILTLLRIFVRLASTSSDLTWCVCQSMCLVLSLCYLVCQLCLCICVCISGQYLVLFAALFTSFRKTNNCDSLWRPRNSKNTGLTCACQEHSPCLIVLVKSYVLLRLCCVVFAHNTSRRMCCLFWPLYIPCHKHTNCGSFWRPHRLWENSAVFSNETIMSAAALGDLTKLKS